MAAESRVLQLKTLFVGYEELVGKNKYWGVDMVFGGATCVVWHVF